ncbi:MAG: MBL fold metallo-hydrolase [Ornithinimicrobium sp.]
MHAGPWTTDNNHLLMSDENVEVRAISVSSMDNNVYLVTCVTTGAQALIDAADEASQIIELVRGAGMGDLASLITTHRHWDHVRALSDVAEDTSAVTAAGIRDASHLPVKPDRRLDHGDAVEFGDVTLNVIGLRGHTPGSIALALDAGDTERPTLLFTGDSLFPGGPGKTETDSDFTSLMDDLTERVFEVYDDSTVVLPGHGDGTTLGPERGQLQQWRQRGW